MNYFTPEWYSEGVGAPSKAYRAHLAPLLPQWPSDVQTLANSISLHDGLLRKFVWDIHEATLFLRLRCGDLQVGYFDLDLHYSGVLFSPLDWASLLTLNANKNSNALYDEVDEEDGRFVHRILFISYRRARRSRRFRASRQVRISRRGLVARAAAKSRYYEVGIRFKQLRLEIAPCKSRFDVSE